RAALAIAFQRASRCTDSRLLLPRTSPSPEAALRVMAAAAIGVHRPQPAADSRRRSVESFASATAPLSPAAPMRSPPSHVARLRSWTLRRIVLRADIGPSLRSTGRVPLTRVDRAGNSATGPAQ